MFKNIKAAVILDEFGKIELNLIRKTNYEFKIEKNDYVEGCIYLDKINNSYVLKSDVKVIPYPYNYFRSFDAYNGIILEFEADENFSFRGLAIERFNPFWTRPIFFEDFTELKDNIQQVLIESNKEYMHIMPISGVLAQVHIYAGEKRNILKLTAGTYFGGSTRINGILAVISISENPYKAVEDSYNTACENDIILTSKKDKKTYPKQLEGLGWCTWNAFYHDVTAAGIEEKLKEFKEKEIPVKWIMIDDGWAQTEGLKLKSGYVDKSKFPEGLKVFIQRIKKEYGIEYVGIWHAFTGYWFGMDKEGEWYSEKKELFSNNNSGIILPGRNTEQAYEFYSYWHKYLKEQGIDFLKVDAQGNAFEFYRNTYSVGESVVNMHNALEQSVLDNFGGVMINCMGMGNIDMFSRKNSCIVRSSDDFFPDKENGFESHITQNVYNAIFSDNLFICDFDMWWTKHCSAKQSSVLRAISGGPVYISDEIGNTDEEYILPLIDDDGKIIRCDNAAKPTADCLFKNPHGGVLKVFNTVDENIVIAVFNLSNEKKSVSINLKDVYASGEYYMYMYFKKECGDFTDGVTIEIQPNDVEIINLYKADGKNKIVKNTNKYISVACM